MHFSFYISWLEASTFFHCISVGCFLMLYIGHLWPVINNSKFAIWQVGMKWLSDLEVLLWWLQDKSPRSRDWTVTVGSSIHSKWYRTLCCWVLQWSKLAVGKAPWAFNQPAMVAIKNSASTMHLSAKKAVLLSHITMRFETNWLTFLGKHLFPICSSWQTQNPKQSQLPQKWNRMMKTRRTEWNASFAAVTTAMKTMVIFWCMYSGGSWYRLHL